MPENRPLSLRRVMLKSSSMMFVTLVLIKLSGYVFNLVFVRYFPQESYGNFVYLWSLAMALVGFLCLEVGGATRRYIAFHRGEGSTRRVYDIYKTGFWLTAVITVIALTLIFILQGYGVFGVGYTEFLFVASLFALHSIAYFFNQVTSGFRRPEVSTMLGLLLNLLKMAVVVTAAVLGFRYGGLLGMLIAGFLLYTLASVTYPLTSFGFKGSFRVEYVSLLVKFGLGLILATTANNILAWGDIFLIRYFMGDSSVAVYNVAWLTSSACLIFFLSVIQIFNPVVTEFFGRKDYKRASRMSSYILELFFLVFMPVFIAVIAFAREIIVLFFTVDYLPGVIPLQVLSVGIFLFGVALLYRELFSAYGKPQLNAVIVGLAAAVNIVSNYLLIPRLGLLGAALSTLASSAFILALSYILARRELSFVSVSPSRPRVLKIVVSSFSIIPVVFVLKAAIENSIASLFVSLAAAALVYATALVFSRSLSKLDVELAETLLRNAGVPEEVKKIVLNVMNSGCGS